MPAVSPSRPIQNLSSNSPRETSTPHRPSRTSSHVYFSRLSKRFFCSPSSSSASPPSSRSVSATTHPDSSTRPPRLCSLKRKSHTFFSRQARQLSLSSSLSPAPAPSPLHQRQQRRRRRRGNQAMSGANMGNQQSSHDPSKRAPPAAPIDWVSAEFFPDQETKPVLSSSPAPPAAPSIQPTTTMNVLSSSPAAAPPPPPPTQSTTTMNAVEKSRLKRPLPPPWSRERVREQARLHVTEIVDLSSDIDDPEEPEPASKRLKIGNEDQNQNQNQKQVHRTTPSHAAIGEPVSKMARGLQDRSNESAPSKTNNNSSAQSIPNSNDSPSTTGTNNALATTVPVPVPVPVQVPIQPGMKPKKKLFGLTLPSPGSITDNNEPEKPKSQRTSLIADRHLLPGGNTITPPSQHRTIASQRQHSAASSVVATDIGGGVLKLRQTNADSTKYSKLTRGISPPNEGNGTSYSGKDDQGDDVPANERETSQRSVLDHLGDDDRMPENEDELAESAGEAAMREHVGDDDDYEDDQAGPNSAKARRRKEHERKSKEKTTAEKEEAARLRAEQAKADMAGSARLRAETMRKLALQEEKAAEARVTTQETLRKETHEVESVRKKSGTSAARDGAKPARKAMDDTPAAISQTQLVQQASSASGLSIEFLEDVRTDMPPDDLFGDADEHSLFFDDAEDDANGRNVSSGAAGRVDRPSQAGHSSAVARVLADSADHTGAEASVISTGQIPPSKAQQTDGRSEKSTAAAATTVDGDHHDLEAEKNLKRLMKERRKQHRSTAPLVVQRGLVLAASNAQDGVRHDFQPVATLSRNSGLTVADQFVGDPVIQRTDSSNGVGEIHNHHTEVSRPSEPRTLPRASRGDNVLDNMFASSKTNGPDRAAGSEGSSENTVPAEATISIYLQEKIDKLNKNRNPEEAAVLEQHELCKERINDLEALKGAMTELARLSCMVEKTLIMEDEYRQLLKFDALVLGDGRSGYAMRKRVTDIRASMVRRAKRSAASFPDENSVQAALVQLCGADKLKEIDEEIKHKEVERLDLGARRQKDSHRRKGQAKGKQKDPLQRTTSNNDLAQETTRITSRPDEFDISSLGIPQSTTKDWSPQKRSQYAQKDADIEAMKRRIRQYDLPNGTTSVSNIAEVPNSAVATANRDADHEVEPVKTPAAREDSESEESEEDEGEEYAMKWPGQSQPKNFTDCPALNASDTIAEVLDDSDTEMQETGSEADATPGDKDAYEPARSDLDTADMEKPTVPRARHQAAVQDLLREQQYREFDDWSDDDHLLFKYVVKGEIWNSEIDREDEYYLLGGYLNLENAEGAVRDFVSKFKPPHSRMQFKIESVWDDGDFSQTMSCNGKVSCRAFVERQMISGRRYPDMKSRRASAPRLTYAVLFEKTLSKSQAGKDGEEEEILEQIETSVKDMQSFTIQSLANQRAKDELLEWFVGYLQGPADRGYLATQRQDLSKYLYKLQDDDELFDREAEAPKGNGQKERMRVWVKKITAKGPSN